MSGDFQLDLFQKSDLNNDHLNLKDDGQKKRSARSGSFIDNMKLPIHRWFRYSAGFSAEWVCDVLHAQNLPEDSRILDPFAGSGTTLLAADKYGIKSYGIEAHPFIVRIAKTKLDWDASVEMFMEKASEVLDYAKIHSDNMVENYPDLLKKCFPMDTLKKLSSLKEGWMQINDLSATSELVWLAITSILRSTSSAGTAQWQYILPKKQKRIIANVFDAYRSQIEMMVIDMKEYQSYCNRSNATIIDGDARNCPFVDSKSIDIVITSPPYANNYDYADSTRLEMTFWGEISSWSDLHKTVRNRLIVSSSQHAAADKLILEEILERNNIISIRGELSEVCNRLAVERLLHGGKKQYHTMIAAYFADLARVFVDLRRVCKPGAKMCFVIGDSAPYGIYVPVDRWLGELALTAGFSSFSFNKLRDRNIKWKNRKHRIPLHEGLLWMEG